MDIWELFCRTGNIDAYLLYTITENSGDNIVYDDEQFTDRRTYYTAEQL
ncbi:MAG: hypothetical protein J1F64_06425 [Oscillospiraceae bacterium]|nr:hypothetical protein [Oscillospiraceae bacterium]